MLTVGLYGINDIALTKYPNFVHDHSITFMRNGRVLSNIPLERYTGIKHDQRLGKFITQILDDWIQDEEPIRFVSVNSFVGNNFTSEDGAFRIEPLQKPIIANILTPARVLWYRNKQLKNYEGWVICHEFAHIASALPFGIKFTDHHLLVHIDGGASNSACSFWRIENDKPTLLHASWNDLKEPVNNFNIGLLGRTILNLNEQDHLSMPGKLMGFAAYGKAEHQWQEYLTKRGFYLDNQWDKTTMQQDLSYKLGQNIELTNLNHHLTKTLAACIQKDFETQINKKINYFKDTINAKSLIYTGGAALNIPTNSLLEQTFGFGQVFVPPCTNDTGLSLGAAAWIEYINGSQIAVHEPFLNCFATSALPTFSLDTIQTTAKAIAAGKIVALCLGGSEIGPRALGHRSILARPDNIEVKTRISEQIKRREWYRPIAPALLPDIANVAIREPIQSSKLAPFMLGSYTLYESWQNKFLGVIHADSTIRAQVVHDTMENKFFYALLKILHQQHNIAGVINTSFNIQGKPIVHFHQDAKPIAKSMAGIDMVVINGSIHQP